MDFIRTDISYDWIEEKAAVYGMDIGRIRSGSDITSLFQDDIAHPVKAAVVEFKGPGGGDPFVELTFMDEDHSWEWFIGNMSQGDADIDVAEYELAHFSAA